MGKSGKINRFEPTDIGWATKFPECATLFRAAGRFSFFEKIIGFNLEVSHHFSQNFINDTVTFNTLSFKLTEDLIAEATGVPIDGESWFKKIPFSFDPNDFLLPGNKTQTGENRFNQKSLSQKERSNWYCTELYYM